MNFPSFPRSVCGVVSLLGLALACLGPACLGATEPAVAPASVLPGRLTGTFEGIECEYSPGQEELARLLAARFAAHNAQIAEEEARPKPPPSLEPLSPAEMKANRADYLSRIAAQLGLKQATPWQEECYDAFVGNYELTQELFETMRRTASDLRRVQRFTLWSRGELVARLEAGEKVPGMAYDPKTKEGKSQFGFKFEGVNSKLSDLGEARKRLRADYRFSIATEEGRAVYRGSVASAQPQSGKKAEEPAKRADQTAAPAYESSAFPVVIPGDLAAEPVDSAAAKLWGDDRTGVRAHLAAIKEFPGRIPHLDPALAGLVLHETTEVGIIDRYLRGPDRRWFCDGVANYVPWRVVRDLHGPEAARAVYDLPAQLARHAALREQADLRKWPAAEKQSDEERTTPLDAARYAFAAQAVFLMHERAGDDILPRLFGEIGKTAAKKTSIKTVEKAWKKLTKTNLDDVLAAATAPLPEAAAAAKAP